MNVSAKLVGNTSNSCWDSHLWSQTAYSMDKKKDMYLLQKLKCKMLATISRFKFTKSRIFSHLHVIVMEMSLEEDALLVSFFFLHWCLSCVTKDEWTTWPTFPNDPAAFVALQPSSLIFLSKRKESVCFVSSSKTSMMNARMNNAYGSWNKLKSNCSCKYTSILDSNAFSAGMFMKFNYPPQNKTNMKKVGTLHAICRKMDRLWRIWFLFPLSGFHSNTMSSLLSILHETPRSPEVGSHKPMRNRQHESDYLWQGIQQKILSP